jgi:hypothetical protein
MNARAGRTSVVLLAVLGAACGSGASESSQPPAAAAEAESLTQQPVSAALGISSSTPPASSGIVYVVHGINGRDLGARRSARVWPGQRRITISEAGSATPAFDQTLELDPFRFYAWYAVGTPKNKTFQVLLQSLPLVLNDHHDWWDDDDSGEKDR